MSVLEAPTIAPPRTPTGSDGDAKYVRPPQRPRQENIRANPMLAIRSVLKSEMFWNSALQLPHSVPSVVKRRGRPQLQPDWVHLLIACVGIRIGSQAAAVAFITDDDIWKLVLPHMHNNTPQKALPANEVAPNRWQFNRFMQRCDTENYDPYTDAAITIARETTLNILTNRGHFNPEQPLVYNHPDKKQWLTLDGTVYKTPSNKKKGKRSDPASANYHTGGQTEKDKPIFGSKFAIAEAISDNYLGNMIIDFEHVQPKPGNRAGDEAAAHQKIVERIKNHSPGLRGITVDTVLYGKHITPLLDKGVITQNVPAAKSNPNRATGGRWAEGREERNHKIRTLTHGPNNRCTHDIYLLGSIPVQKTLNAEGETDYIELPTTRCLHKTNKKGKHTYRLEVNIPCPRHGDQPLLIRLDTPQRGDIQLNNRADLARYYPHNTPQAQEIRGWRNVSEITHAYLKKDLPKIPAYGKRKQKLFMLAAQIITNALSQHHHGEL